MTQKCNHDFKGKYHYIWTGTLEPMCTQDILAKIPGFLPYASVLECQIRHVMDIKIDKELKTSTVVDISLHSLKRKVKVFY